jgi:hypothetical protein
MTTSAKKHYRLHFQTDNGAILHDKCDAGTNGWQSYAPSQCHWSSMSDYPSINGHDAQNKTSITIMSTNRNEATAPATMMTPDSLSSVMYSSPSSLPLGERSVNHSNTLHSSSAQVHARESCETGIE